MSDAVTSNSALVASLQVRHPAPVIAGATSGISEQVESVWLRDGESLRVGRFEGNEIVLRDTNASRFHAVFNASEGALYVTDLSSLNGTFVNERRITAPTRLSHGDLVRITDWLFTVGIEKQSPQVGTPSATSADTTQSLGMRAIFVTVLVADVNQYTKMAEQLELSALSQMLDGWIDLVGRVVKSHGGTIESTQGDSVLALWRPLRSSPSRDELRQHAVSALRAAREILAGTLKLSELGVWPYEETFPWRCKISLHSGEALEGIVGGGEHRQHSIIGDAINIAFRLNDLCYSLQKSIVTTGITQELAGAEFPLEKLTSVVLEGRAEPVTVWG